MSATSVQFTVAAHIMAALGFRDGEELPSAMLAESVNADTTFVRKSLSKLSKAGLKRSSTFIVPARHLRLSRFTAIQWRRDARSAATLRDACRRS